MRVRSGFTMLEMVISMTLLLVITAASVSVLRQQTLLFGSQEGRLDAEQNARFAILSIDRELRMAGAGTVAGQPMLVQASPTAITFNADLVSNTPGDLVAVYINPDADTNTISVLRHGSQVRLPGSSTFYPNSTYMRAVGQESGAETISYYLSQDSTSTHANEYVLFRRVNAATPQVIARGIQHSAADTVFQFFKSDTAGNQTPIPQGALPLYHTAVVHSSKADTGAFALIDSVKTVRVNLTTVYHDPKNGDISRHVATTVRILNAGLPDATTCGEPPLSVSPTFTTSLAGATQPFVTVNWAPSGDQTSGEKDVEKYSIYRRLSTDTYFTAEYANVPAGQLSYSFTDTNVQSGMSYIYGVAAWDCTPNSSSIGVTTVVNVP